MVPCATLPGAMFAAALSVAFAALYLANPVASAGLAEKRKPTKTYAEIYVGSTRQASSTLSTGTLKN